MLRHSSLYTPLNGLTKGVGVTLEKFEPLTDRGVFCSGESSIGIPLDSSEFWKSSELG